MINLQTALFETVDLLQFTLLQCKLLLLQRKIFDSVFGCRRLLTAETD